MIITEDIKKFFYVTKNLAPILCLDYGSRKSGLAISISVEQVIFSVPINVIRNCTINKTLSIIKKTIIEKKAIGLVIGWPTLVHFIAYKSMKTVSHIAQNINQQCNIPILLYDESFSTKDALDQLKYHNCPKNVCDKIEDQVAASIILDSAIKSFQASSCD